MDQQRRSQVLRYALELLVVFVGVWLGLLADDYREVRQDRAAERVSVDRLVRDLEFDRRDMAGNLGRLSAANEAGRWLLERADAVDADRDSLEHRLTQFQLRSILVANTSEYTALKSAGRLNIIRDVTLRQDITEFYESYPFIAALHELEQSEVRRAMEHVAPYVRLGFPEESGFATARLVADPQSVLANPGFLLALSEVVSHRTELERIYQGKLRRIEALRARALADLGVDGPTS